MTVQPRIKVPERARAGERITIRTLVSHPMESGLRADQSGGRIARRILNRFVCSFEGEVVLSCELEPAMAANPYFEFTVTVTRSGSFRFEWHEDGGAVIEAEAHIEVDD
ncbi:thiosulfate oxidation carrier complex protein SoxZ [Chthonobacter albigriseus]|uniref:thiosulfate oxidation carrier complex protein SoxZ n=1 Tax=Chthonobacter albigriseus TaxID=1683161 RepID=UPI0015EF2E0E|nr:thiosulfate oxidation carrier complex protein SoxZ [Chthonobacter albigriseus]